MPTLLPFLHGVLTTLSLVASLFFLEFWRATRDRFFLFVVTTFVLLALTWTIQIWASEEHAVYVYSTRLFAFASLLVGIFDKNRAGRETTAGSTAGVSRSELPPGPTNP